MKAVLLLAAAAGVAAHTRNTYHHSAPGEFTTVGRASPSAIMRFTAALPMRNADVLDAKLMDISSPASPHYTEWMTQAEVSALIAPDPAVRAAVAQWLAAGGATCTDWPSALRCTAPVSSVEAMFATQVTEFTQAPSGLPVLRVHPDAPFVMPAALEGSLLFVTQVTDFPTRRLRLGGGIRPIGSGGGARVGGADPNFVVTPETLNALYAIDVVKGSPAASTGPAEFVGNPAITPADQQAFATAMGLPMWNMTRHGAFTGSNLESILDAQYIYAVGPANTQFYWTDPAWMYEFTQELLTVTPIAQVYSISWGWSEADQCYPDPTGCQNGGTTARYVAQTNTGFAAVGALGITILVSSGDSGAHGRSDGTCTSPMTHPDYPAASPYILSVGATALQTGGTALANPQSPYCKTPSAGTCAGGGVEIVATPATGAEISTGGGFSLYAARPSWQDAAVTRYLASGATLPGTGNFNATNRGYPDVSAIGHRVLVFAGGRPEPVDGTSCSAPIFGGVIGLANAARLAAGKRVLGFANQAIYTVAASTPTAFHDITSGDNSCTENGCRASCTGFGATAGWDASTGWGTPNVPVLVAALAAL